MRVSERFEKIEEIKELFPEEVGVVGVGVTAYPRSALGYLLPNYQILSLLETADLGAIRKICPVISVEKGLGGECPQKFNTSSILSLPPVKKWLMNFRPRLFVYKDSEAIDRIAQKLGVKILGTEGKIRKVFENKKFFRQELVKAGLKPIQGCSLQVEELDEKKWEFFRAEWGERLVFQLTDYTVGGGLGTFFISSKKNFMEFKEFVTRRREVRKELGKVIEWVNVTKFIQGETASILGCATKFGTVTGGLQKQIIDQPELAALSGRSGVWLGHDWNVRFSPEAQAEGEKLCQQWGDYIYKQGYKGIFGLDIIVNKNNQVLPIECNSRYTGAFPMYTMMQIDNHEMPLDVWHLLEWMGVDYEMDIEAVQKLSRGAKKGAQLLLHNLERKTVTATKTVKVGIYRMLVRQTKFSACSHLPGEASGCARKNLSACAIKYVRPGFSLMDIKGEDEFILCDRVVGEESVLKPAERLGRLVFKRQVINEKGRLLPEIQQVVKVVYESFELMPVEVKNE
ncbi:MAG: hypothetical protein U0946_04045 [Patescibacteria group bacterium]|nr:hypothetical protein [Patescibacteria group bacterium]